MLELIWDIIKYGTLLIIFGIGWAWFHGITPEVGHASSLIQKQLKSPSSFVLTSGEMKWEGDNKNGKPAYVVKVLYDAENGFGATIRECALVALWKEDGLYKSLPNSVDACKIDGIANEAQMVNLMKDLIMDV